jgi:hypothetical protein
MVSIYDDPDVPGAQRFTFVPKGVATSRVGTAPPQYIVSVRGHGSEAELNWIQSASEPPIQDELESEARRRASLRHEWLDKLRELLRDVDQWAKQLGWVTKEVSKKMEDTEIGNYEAPALLLQHETVRLFLEPIARVAPGADGVVDLYLMPSYDDIASLYHNDGRWNLHYMFEGTPSVASIRDAEARPLSLETLRQVFDEMKAHAG